MGRNNWIKQGSYSFLNNASSLGFAFFHFFILVRVLSKEDFGVWVLYTTVTSFVEMVRIGMIQNGMIKYLTEEKKEDHPQVVASALFLNFIVGLVGALLLIIFGKHISYYLKSTDLQPLFFFYPIYFITFGNLKVLHFIQMSMKSFKKVFISNSINGILFLIFIIVLWVWNPNIPLYQLILLQSVAALLALIYSFISARELNRFGRLDKEYVLKLFHFGKYVVGTNFNSMLINKLDIIMIGYFGTPIAVAIYNVPSRINNYFNIPLNSVSELMYPHIAEKNRECGVHTISAIFEKSVGLLIAILVPIILILILFPDLVIILFAGRDYLEATPLLILFALLGIAKPWGRIFGITLDAIGKPKLNMKVLMMSLFINFILNLLLIPKYGLIGAAVATLLSVYISTAIGQMIITKILKINYLNPFKYALIYYKVGFLKSFEICVKSIHRLRDGK